MSPALPDEVTAFLREQLPGEWSSDPLAGDASARTYFRVRAQDGVYILAYYPAELRAQLERFIAAHRLLAPHTNVPALVRHSAAAVLQHDVGDVTLFDLLHRSREEGLRLYREAIRLLAGFQRAGATEINPPFSANFFANELEMTREFYVERLMEVPEQRSRELTPLFERLCSEIERHPYVLCHRDFHGQNLHWHEGSLYVIDFQDLRQGPDTYDLASLLRDRGVGTIIGDEEELSLLEFYRSVTAGDAGLRRRYFETLLQRSLKVLGTFAKQAITRGKVHYLEYIRPALESIRRCVAELPQYGELIDMIPADFNRTAAEQRLQEKGDA